MTKLILKSLTFGFFFRKNSTVIFTLSLLILLTSCGKKTTEVQPIRKDITEMVFAAGSLVPDNMYNLTAQSEGYLIALNIEEGTIVAKNQVLAVIDNKSNAINAQGSAELLAISQFNASAEAPNLKQVELSIRLAKEKAEQDRQQFERYQKLYASNSVSKLEMENMKLAYENSKTAVETATQNYQTLKKAAEQQLVAQKVQSNVNEVFKGNNEILAVLEGKVYKKIKQLGDYVRRGEVIAVIGNADQLYAKLNVDEANIAKVRLNQEVLVRLNSQKTKTYKGVVSEVYPSFDEATQSFFVKVRFSEPLDFKISGTQLEANIVIGEKKNALLIPRNMLAYGNKVKIAGVDTLTNIKVGTVSTQWVEILEGLSEKDKLVPYKPQL
jgi:HlyD family secretion protein